jgi:membrane-anchored protein YejM (alkaline phosphatase superfamily)
MESKTPENFREDEDEDEDRRDRRDRRDDDDKISWTWLIIEIILGVVFGVFAVWLSWSSNSVAGYNIALKILFAIFAFLFGFLYIISHIMFKLDLLNALKIAQMKQQIQASSKGAVGGRR